MRALLGAILDLVTEPLDIAVIARRLADRRAELHLEQIEVAERAALEDRTRWQS